MPAWIIKYFPLVLTGVVWVVTFGVGYWQGFDTCNTKWKVKTEKETGRYLEQINEMTNILRQNEIVTQEKINAIIGEQLDREEQIKNDYEKTIADLHNDKYEFDGVRECPSETASQSLSRKPATSSDVVCYSKAELQQKIERSLAIAKECDELAEKYERLKEVYNVRSR